LSAPEQLVSGADRVEGFLDTWKSGGGFSARTVHGGFTAEGGQEAIRSHSDVFSSGIVTAVFAVNDEMAIGALREFRAQGISVPGQVSVMGFDDIRAASDVYPSLTTVRQDVALLGERAAEILLVLLDEAEESVVGESVPVELVVRESTSPVGWGGMSNTRVNHVSVSASADSVPERGLR
jgi:LacI family transcriptional regulator